MREDIKVHVVSYGRKYLYMRYIDPVTETAVARSTRETRRREAEKVAAKWEAELQEGRYKSPLKVSWVEFRHRYEDEVLPSLAHKTGAKVDATFNAVARILNPQKLAGLTADRISRRKESQERLVMNYGFLFFVHFKGMLRDFQKWPTLSHSATDGAR
jgi:hypothetical protein